MVNFDEEEYRQFIEKNARTYGKAPEEIEKTAIAKEFKKYLIDRDKDKTGGKDE